MDKSDKSVVLFLKILPIAFILYTVGVMGYMLFNKDVEYAVRVAPAADAAKQTLASYSNSKVTATGNMIVPEPGIGVKILWPPHNHYLSSFIECLFILFIALQVFFIFNDMPKATFRENIAKYLERIGWAFFVLYLVNMGRKILVERQVLSFSNNEFELDGQFGTSSWIAVLFLLLALAAKKIVGLQKEQELTI